MNRRDFLLSLAGAACFPGCTPTSAPLPPGTFVGPSLERGHRLRSRDFPAPSETRRIGIAIVGGGIGGLSAAWKLARVGFGDFRLFELEDEVGGNARSGQNAVSAYPWGAHYLPLPGTEARAVRELLADLDVLQGNPYVEAPRYDERHLCFAPQERLYRNGAWQEGLLPQIGATNEDREQYQRFFQLVSNLKHRRGKDGRRAFALPMALSSRDDAFLAYDRISMKDFLLGQGLDSAPLHWYVNYACRDDFGSDYAITSAWAGLHYFASRDGRAQDAESDQVLTWPEGNGWLVKQMRARVAGQVETGALVHRIEETRGGMEIDVFDLRSKRSVRWQARQVIFAAPAFVLPHVLANPAADLQAAIREIHYAPWLVANLTLHELPTERSGAALAWDNVLYDSPALGYVVATHQSLRSHSGPTVLTYYWALSEHPPEQARTRLFKASRDEWVRSILADLSRPHPGLRDQVEQLDLFRWAHAMAQPRPGFLSSAARQRINQPTTHLHFAHADASGFSIFEEANYRGVHAAESALKQAGIKFDSSLA
jgi:protoporphyrinogen oxidase